MKRSTGIVDNNTGVNKNIVGESILKVIGEQKPNKLSFQVA